MSEVCRPQKITYQQGTCSGHQPVCFSGHQPVCFTEEMQSTVDSKNLSTGGQWDTPKALSFAFPVTQQLYFHKCILIPSYLCGQRVNYIIKIEIHDIGNT